MARDLNTYVECSKKGINLSYGEGNDKGKARQHLQSPGSNTKHRVTEPLAEPQLKLNRSVVEEDEFWPLSGKPYFNCIIVKSHIKPSYQMGIPVKIHPLLPSAVVPVVLTCQNKNWKMLYYGDRNLKRFDPNWKSFANDNNLKVGDACVFELMESSSKLVKFRVQILSGEIPSDFIGTVDGESLNTPIVIE